MEIPQLVPFEFQGRQYIDVRSLDPGIPSQAALKILAVGKRYHALSTLPPEMLCTGIRPRGNVDPVRGAFSDLSIKEYLGEILPILLASFDGDVCVDFFELNAITIEPPFGSPRSASISCRLFPGFLDLIHDDDGDPDDDATHLPWAEAAMDLGEFCADQEFDLLGGGKLDVRAIIASNNYVTDGTVTHADVRARLVVEESDRRADQPERSSRIERESYDKPGRNWTIVRVESKRKDAV